MAKKLKRCDEVIPWENKKRRKHYASSSSSENESKIELKWVEASPPKKPVKEHKKRESWMTDETFVPTLSKNEMAPIISSRQRRLAAMKEKQEKDDKIIKERELNPFIKNVGREKEKEIGKAICQHQKLHTVLQKCFYCLDQQMKKYLILDVGEEVYLSLPNYQTLTEGHCLIVPKSHVSSLLHLNENEWKEVDVFKNHLRNLFRSKNKTVIFLETSMNFCKFPHAILECVPVPEEEGDMAPFYFKKAIQESEAEWSHNKKLVDLKGKSLRHSVPKSLPYFHVEFDPKIHAGYAHVIEEEKHFPRNFGKEIVGGMLDINYNHLYKNRKEDPLKKSKEVVEFQRMWKKFKTESL